MGWVAPDLIPDGVMGNAALANAEKGAAIADHEVAGFIAMLRALRETPLP